MAIGVAPVAGRSALQLAGLQPASIGGRGLPTIDEEERKRKEEEERQRKIAEAQAKLAAAKTKEEAQTVLGGYPDLADVLKMPELPSQAAVEAPSWQEKVATDLQTLQSKLPPGYKAVDPYARIRDVETGVPTLRITGEDQYLNGIRAMAERMGQPFDFPAQDTSQMSSQERRIYRDSLREMYRSMLHLEHDYRMGYIPEGWEIEIREPELVSELPPADIATMGPEQRQDYYKDLEKKYRWGWDYVTDEYGFLKPEPLPSNYGYTYTTPGGWQLTENQVITPQGQELTVLQAKNYPGVAERFSGEFSEGDITELNEFAEAKPGEFVQSLERSGYTFLTLATLKRMGLGNAEIETIYPQVKQEKQSFLASMGAGVSARGASYGAVLPAIGKGLEWWIENINMPLAQEILFEWPGIKTRELLSPEQQAEYELLEERKKELGAGEEWQKNQARMKELRKEAWDLRQTIEKAEPAREVEMFSAKGLLAYMKGEITAEEIPSLGKMDMSLPTATAVAAFAADPIMIIGGFSSGTAKILSRATLKILAKDGEEAAIKFLTEKILPATGEKFTELQAKAVVRGMELKGAQIAMQKGGAEAVKAGEAIAPKAAEKIPEAAPKVIPEIPRTGFKATDQVAQRIAFETPKQTFTEKLRRGWDEFNKKILDDLYAIRKFRDVAAKAGKEIAMEADPYIAARMLRGWQSKANVWLEKGTFGKEFWEVTKGGVKPKFVGEGLTDILKPVSEGKIWQDFAIYLTSKHAVELNTYGIKTGLKSTTAKAAIRELEKAYPVFNGVAEKIYKYNSELLNFAKETGLISEAAVKKMQTKYGSYVPFSRVFEKLQRKGFFGKGMANIASPIKRIKGSERQIINPLESMVRNTYLIVNAGERNQVGIMMANLIDKNPELLSLFTPIKTSMNKVATVTAKELGLKAEGLSDDLVNQAIDIFRPSMFTKDNVVTVLVNGKRKFFKVDPEIRNALLSLDREQMGSIMRVFSAPTRWLRAGATLSPDFMARNPIRDQMTAFVYSKYGFMPGVDFTKGVASMIGKDDKYWLYRMSGAEHSMFVSMDREYLTKTFAQVLKGKPTVEYFKHPLEALRVVSEAGEKGTRLGEFGKALTKGATPIEAGFASRDVTLDFAKAGTTAKVVNQLVAFFNANVRGWDKLIQAFKEKPLQTSLKTFGGITMPSVLLYLANRDDPRWKEIPQWQKDLFWIVMTEDNIYRIPKPFELGIIFGSVPERFLEWMDEKDPNMIDELAGNLVEAGSPGFIPTFAQPILEWMTNYNFFQGKQIVSEGKKKMPPELQYTHYTSEAAKKMGEWLKLPPAQIDNLLYAWTAGLGRYAIEGVDAILKGTGIASNIPEPSKELADMPVAKAFVVRNPIGSSSESVNKFYTTLEKYEKNENYFQEMMRLGKTDKAETFKLAHPELLLFYDYEYKEFYSKTARSLRKIARNMSEITRIENQIYDAPNIDSKTKRDKINQCEEEKTKLAREALDFLEKWPAPQQRD